MSRQHIVSLLRSTLIATMVLFIVSSTASAHCDGMDGPVVKAARRALETHDASLVLIWVQKKDEAEVRQVFQATLAVRNLSPDAKERPIPDSNPQGAILGRQFPLQTERLRKVPWDR
jgi:Family of unknown function (DUF6448)